MIEVKLEKSEIMALDGKVNADAQKIIDRLKRIDAVSSDMALNDKEASLVSDAIDEAQKSKILIRRPCRVSKCRVCGRGETAILYKSGRNKGRVKGYISGPGYDLAESFIRMDGYPKCGACADCVNRLMPSIIAAISEMEIDIVVPGETSKWKRVRNRKCSKCGWVGHEDEMGKERTIIGDGWYAARCPKCPAKNGLGFSEVPVADGYTMLRRKEKE